MSVVGIDACKSGWIAIELRDEATGHFIDKLENLSAHVPDAETVASHDLVAVADGVAVRLADVVWEGRHPSLVLSAVLELRLQRGAGVLDLGRVFARAGRRAAASSVLRQLGDQVQTDAVFGLV